MHDAKNKADKSVPATDKSEEIRSLYLESLQLVERLHRRLLDVIKDEFDRNNRSDINAIQALLLFNIGDAELTAGYFHLAKAATDVAIDAWEMDPEWLEAAHTCAEGVIADVLAGKFAHLVSRGDRDGLASWHLGLPEKTLDLTFVGGDASPVP